MRAEQQKIVPECHAFANRPNWYLRERSAPIQVQDVRTRKYFELEERTDDKGFKGQVLVEKDYPITPEYVSSFAASSDYRADPVGAINRAPVCRNLGDITAVQEALGLDYETARHVYAEYLRVLAAQTEKEEGTPAPVSAPAPAAKGGDSNV